MPSESFKEEPRFQIGDVFEVDYKGYFPKYTYMVLNCLDNPDSILVLRLNPQFDGKRVWVDVDTFFSLDWNMVSRLE